MNEREFLWTVWDGGYEWKLGGVKAFERYGEEGTAYDRKSLCLVHPSFNDSTHYTAQEYRSRSYAPLRIPNFYETFAAVEPSEEGVSAFVRRYGSLGERAEAWSVGQCEPLELWRKEIYAVARVLALRDLLGAPPETRARAFTWEGTRYTLPLPGKTFVEDTVYIYQFEASEPEPESWLIRRHLLVELNAALDGRVYAGILMDLYTFDPKPYYSARTLLGAVWLQLMSDVAGNLEWPRKRCEQCGRLLDSVALRADAKFCKDKACKQAAYRLRVKARGETGGSAP